MAGYTRYAIYYAPPNGSLLARVGAAWLGRDVETGAAVAHPDVPGLPRPVAELTEAPRRYGFHGTLKAPFRLAEGRDLAALASAVAALAATRPAVEGPPLALRRLGRFLALVPSAPFPGLAALAAACVTGLDAFRAPLGAGELARRRAAGLDPAEEANLRTWGYPYVLDRFRFHLTLTGPLAPDEMAAVEAALGPVVAPLCAAPFAVGEICLFGEVVGGDFCLLHRYPLGG